MQLGQSALRTQSSNTPWSIVPLINIFHSALGWFFPLPPAAQEQERQRGKLGLQLNNASFKLGAPIKPPGGLCLWKLVALAASFPSAVPEGEVRESQEHPSWGGGAVAPAPAFTCNSAPVNWYGNDKQLMRSKKKSQTKQKRGTDD